ncbi:zinc-binding dehydrogenase [Terriglobus albidus]|uniref:Zinc-binding dehydrogenase n=1 Tax=Terriglobus albidus TaxID=1592106 RepID=A0A5B9EGZ6_9BACT|nr:alcohol dehydrogenase catalytic domain-containing protein [Terriglobus albidus]QEE29607.1 zinc-binding dehydrogenase [Terriglobus albidus]
MRAAVIEELNRPLVIQNVPDPECPPDGAIIRVGANGICRTDWHLWTNDWTWRGLAIQPPFVLGHEFSGTVEEVGRDVKSWRQGDRVIFPMNPGEGSCEWCRSGNQHVCNSGAKLVPGVSYWGAFAEYVMVRYADVNLVRLPESLSFVESASMACRYMAAFRGIVDQAEVRGGEWVVVHGAGGGMGLSSVQIAAAVGARVIAVDVSERALSAARTAGAEFTINSRKESPIEAVRTITQGGAHVSLDALGIAETCRNSVLSLRKLGRHIQLGHTTRKEEGYVPLPIDVILLNELRLFGSFGMQGQQFGTMLSMCEARILRPGQLVSKQVDLGGVNAVLEAMGDFGTTGVVVVSGF